MNNLAYRFDQEEAAKVLPKPAKWLFPTRIAEAYFKYLNILVSFMIELTEEMLIPALPGLVAQANAIRPDHFDTDDSISFEVDRLVIRALKGDDIERSAIYDLLHSSKRLHRDQYPEQISSIINGMELKYAEQFPPSQIESAVTVVGGEINAFNANQFQKVFKSVLGVDVFISEPWLSDAMKTFVRENVALIKSLSQDYFTQIETITFRDIRAGKRHEEIAEDIQSRYGVTRNRARLIARDQTNKFNGQLTQLRQQSAGVKGYIWQTVGDNRVRPRHAERDNEPFAWDEEDAGESAGGFVLRTPPSDGHPGEPVQCFPGNLKLDMVLGCEKFYRRRYSGELTTIVTGSNETLSATPNHPILTLDGWKPIQAIDKRDYIFKIMKESIDFPEHNIQNRNISIDQIFNTLFFMFTSIVRRKGSRFQFHGDGSDKEIDIIDMDSFLPDEFDISEIKKVGELIFSVADNAISDSFLSGKGQSLFMLKALFNSSDSIMRGFCKLLSLFSGQSGHSQEACLTAISNFNISLSESNIDSSPAYPVFLRYFQDAHAGGVIPNNFIVGKLFAVMGRMSFSPTSIDTPCAEELAEIVRVNTERSRGSFQIGSFLYKPFRVVEKFVSEFSDHVFNLQTVNGWYTIANNFAVVNCRCWGEPIITPEVARRFTG